MTRPQHDVCDHGGHLGLKRNAPGQLPPVPAAAGGYAAVVYDLLRLLAMRAARFHLSVTFADAEAQEGASLRLQMTEPVRPDEKWRSKRDIEAAEAWIENRKIICEFL